MRAAALAALLALVITGCAPAAPAASGSTPDQSAVSAMAPIPEPEPPTIEEQARAILEGMTREEKAGQLFFAQYPGENAAQLAGELGLGGYVLFGRDFKDSTPDEVRQNIAACQQASAIPMLMAVDEEGGTVVRVSRYPAFRAEKFKSPQAVFAAGGFEAVRADALEKSQLLLDLGLNVNLAPVCDLSTDPGDFMYQRAFGQGAEETAQYVSTVAGAMEEAGMGSVLKHFPGYGSSGDTHKGMVLDQRPLAQFKTEDLLPFRAGFQSGAGAVLVCHNIVSCLDESLPASLSPTAYALLREELDFDGVAMTDDLSMDAVAQFVENGSAAVTALQNGADMVMTGKPREQLSQVLAALDSGALSPQRLDEAAQRVLCWKLRLGIISTGADGPEQDAPNFPQNPA